MQGNPVSYTDPFGLSPLNGLFTGTGWVHGLLGLAGCIPGLLGAGANLADAFIYGFVDHDYGMAALSGVCAVTAGAGSIARMVAEGSRLQRGTMYVAKASELVTNTAIAVRSGIGAATTGYGMYQKYVVNEEKMGWDTVGECAALLLNAVTLGTSTVNLASSAQALGKMMKEDNVAGKLTDAVKRGINTVKGGTQTLWADNSGGVLVGSNSSNNSQVYYHVTTEEAAKKIMESGELGVRGNRWEARVFAWIKQPTKRQASIAGIGKEAQTVIQFSTNASFQYDDGNIGKSIEHMVVQTVDGQRVPISVWDVKIVGFKKGWWQFWKK